MEQEKAVALLQSGDISGLETLVKLYQTQGVKTAALITGDPELAEDIVQSAFIRIAEKIHQFDSLRPFGPWFYRIVANDAVKAAKRRERYLSPNGNSAIEYDLFIDPLPLPEEQVESDQTRQAVWRALESLPPEQRAAIVLRYYLGMSEREIAEELDSPVGTIKWRLFTARNRLEHLLKPIFGFERPKGVSQDEPEEGERK